MKKYGLGLAMAVAAFAALSSPVMAQSSQTDWSWLNGFYVRGDVGAGFGQKTTFTDNNPAAANTFLGTGSLNASTGNSIYFDGGIGYRFNPMFRTDFTLGYLPSLKASGTVTGGPLAGASGSGGVNSLLGLGNGYLDLNGIFPTAFGPFQPYIDAGLGFASNSYSGFTGKNAAGLGASINGATQTNFAWGVGTGVAYPITSQLSLDLAYKYVDLGGMKSGSTAMLTGVTAGSSGIKSTDLNVHLVTLGLRWAFAAPPPPPPPMAAPAPAAMPAPPPAMAARMFIVFFDFDKATLTPDGKKVVDAAAAAFKSGGNPQLQLSGYTDLAGTAAYNLKLSQRRADTVAAALEKDGVPKSVITTHAMGKTNPRVPTADGVREPQNRRVEIVFPS
jgi:outer membrane protein OmpA-like peptidoglycan-associated protein